MSQVPQVDSWDAVEKAMFVVLGWLLALLTTPIVESIKRSRELKQAKLGVTSELAEFKYRMAIVCYYIEGKYGKRDHTFLEWIKPLIATYAGPMPAESVVKAVEIQLGLTTEQLKSYRDTLTNPEQGLSLKEYPVPFFESRVETVAWLPDAVRRLMLEINTQIHMLDAERQNTEYYFRLTFDEGLSSENRERVRGNLENGYRNYARIAKVLIQRIGELEAAWA